tara:strand:+ start:3089 stop:6043 length:2955 start_codon:yes stop_codon:yes gene_type:complete
MPQDIIEDSWPLGYIPSHSPQEDRGGAKGLVRMDNITLDEQGNLSAAKGSGVESTATLGQVNSIGGMYYSGQKLRYTYDSTGLCLRNYGGAASLTNFDLTVFSGGSTSKASFLNALGHQFICAGTAKYKDRGDVQFPLGIAAGAAPALANLASSTVNLSNLDGGGNYTNWTSIESSAYNDAGALVSFTPNATTSRGIIQTVFGAVVDTTNFGSGTGYDTPDDYFTFNFLSVNPDELTYFKIDLYCTDPSTGITDEYWVELDYANFATNTNPNNPYIPVIPFTLTPNTTFAISIQRKSFQHIGTSATLNWTTIAAVRLTVGGASTSGYQFSSFTVRNGATTGDQEYVCVEVRNTGQYVEQGLVSAIATVTANISNVTVNRSGSPVAAQCNQIRFYRRNATLGLFLEVKRQTGANGFTPSSFTDSLSDLDALIAYGLDSTLALDSYRTALPSDIVDMLWFRDRVIYLTTTSFIPSYYLDPGSYDSRYVYQIVGNTTETILFIAKLDVNSFLIATSQDFIRVSGTFVTLDLGNGNTTLDVTIQPLGISDPAISRSFLEFGGSIVYMSATGIRTLANSTSTLLNGPLDLLFRKNARYGIPYIPLLPADQSVVSCVSSGNRMYWGLPQNGATTATFISTLTGGGSYWRLNTSAPRAMYREEDGTVLFSTYAGGNYLYSMENSSTAVPIKLTTLWTFGNSPDIVKDAASLKILANTGGASLTYVLTGIKEDGTTTSQTGTISASGELVANIDISSFTGCIAFWLDIAGSTNTFTLNYFIITISNEDPPLIFSIFQDYSNFGKLGDKILTSFPFVANPNNGIITAVLKGDGTTVASTEFTGARTQTLLSQNNQGIKAIDWSLNLSSPTGFRFFKFLPPEVAQVFPTRRTWDQLGPIDLNAMGIVFGMRIRFQTTVALLTYTLYDSDTVVYTDTVTTTVGKDLVYTISFPMGVNSSIFKVIFTADTYFYRFNVELLVRVTKQDTEGKYIAIG